MSNYHTIAIGAFLCLHLTSCVIPQQPLTAEQNRESQRRINEIEDEGFRLRDRERRSAADAERISNIGAPPVQYHQHNTYAPVYSGW